jgi:hypothetical protein
MADDNEPPPPPPPSPPKSGRWYVSRGALDRYKEARKALDESDPRAALSADSKSKALANAADPNAAIPMLGGGGGGFQMSVLPGTRAVPGYPVTKDELERLGDAQTQTQTFYAIGAFFASFFLGTVIDGALTAELTPVGEAVNLYGPWFFGILAAAFFFLGWNANRRRKGLIADIVDQTQHGEKRD